MKIKIKLTNLGMLAVALLAIIAIMQVTVTAVYLGETEINVTVTDLSEVTIIPTLLNFSAAPGAQSSEVTLEVWNTGSNNITNMYASVDTSTDESSDPIPAGDPGNFASSGFLMLKNSSDAGFFYAGRLEWNLSTPPASAAYGAKRSNSTGYFRNASGNYMWQLANNGTEEGAYCNTTGTELWIEDDRDQGIAASRTPTGGSGNFTWDEGTNEWGLFSSAGGPLANHCVATYWDCTKIYIYHWDMNATFDGCANSSYIKAGGLVPGQLETITATAVISEGVPDGVLAQSTLTIHGTAA